MDVDIQRVRSLLSVNKLSLESSPEEIRTLLRSAHYTEKEIDAALVLLATPTPPHTKGRSDAVVIKPGMFQYFTKEKKKVVPKERKTQTYTGAGMTGIVVEHKRTKRTVGFLLTLLVLFFASVYVSGALSHVAYSYKLPLLCEGVMWGHLRDSCIAGEAPVWTWEWEELLLP